MLNNGMGHRRNIFSAVEPKRTSAKSVRPFVPMTRMSAFSSSIAARSSRNGTPVLKTVLYRAGSRLEAARTFAISSDRYSLVPRI